MTNRTTKMAQVSIEIYGNLHIFKIWHAETFWNFAHCLTCGNVTKCYGFNKSTLFLF